MSQSPTSGQHSALDDEACYPPCLCHSAEEKKLYKKLKDVYFENYTSWDAEAREAWPSIVEHATLPKSTANKITNHWIARNMMAANVTWAHVVALRVIYKEQIHRSKKLMKLIRDKFPRANFKTYAFHEGYKRHIKIDGEAKAEKTEPGAREPRAGAGGSVREALQPAPRRSKEASKGFLSDEEDVRPTETAVALDVTRPKLTAAANKGDREGHTAMKQENANSAKQRQHIANPSSQRKRALPEDADGEDEAHHNAAREPPPQKQKKDKPSTAANDRRTQPTSSDKGPHSQEEATGSSSGTTEARDDKLDQFIEALASFGKALLEHSKAVDRNSELLRKLTELIQKRRSRPS